MKPKMMNNRSRGYPGAASLAGNGLYLLSLIDLLPEAIATQTSCSVALWPLEARIHTVAHSGCSRRAPHPSD
jgi:hypothetical protein